MESQLLCWEGRQAMDGDTYMWQQLIRNGACNNHLSEFRS